MKKITVNHDDGNSGTTSSSEDTYIKVEAFTRFIYMIDTIVECKNVQISEVWIKLNTGTRVTPTIKSNGMMIYLLVQYTKTIHEGFLFH